MFLKRCIGFALLLILPCPLLGEDRGFASLVPEETVLFVSIPSMKRHWEAFRTLPIYAAYQEREVQDYLNSFGTTLAGATAGVQKNLVRHLFHLRELFGGELAFALVTPGENPLKSMHDWAFMMSSKEEHSKASAFVREVLVPFLSTLFPSSAKKEDMEGVTLTCFFGSEYSLYMAQIENRVFFTGTRERMRDLLRRGSDARGSLSRCKVFQSACGRVLDEDSTFLIYIAFERIAGDFLSQGDERAEKLFHLSGLDGLRSIAAGLNIEKGRVKDAVWLDLPKERKGLFRAFTDIPVDKKLSQLAPKDAFLFWGGNLHFDEAYESLVAVLDAWTGEKPDTLGETRRELSEEFTLRSLSDLVPLLGTEAFFFLKLPPGGYFPPELAVAVEVLEPDRFQTNLLGLLRTNWRGGPKSFSFRNRWIYYMPFAPAPAMLNYGVSVSWCLTNGYLLASIHPMYLKRIIYRMDQRLPSIAEDSDFAAAWGKLPRHAGIVGYANVRQLFELLFYLTVLPQPFGRRWESLFDPYRLPTAEAVASHLTFGLTGLTCEEGGLFLKSDTDGYGPTSLALYGLAAALFIAPFNAWEEQAGLDKQRLEEQGE